MRTRTGFAFVAAALIGATILGLMFAAELPKAPPSVVAIPEEFKGKIPKRAATVLFGDLTAFAGSMLRHRPPLVSLQCFSVISTLGSMRGEMNADNFPRSLDDCRRSGYLLWEHEALTDASGNLPSDFDTDEEVQRRWLDSAPHGTFFVYYKGPHKDTEERIIAELFTAKCTVPPSPFKRDGYFVTLDVAPSGDILQSPLLPESARALISEGRSECLWTSRAQQVRFAYAGFVLTKGKLSQSPSDLEEAFGKKVESAWQDETLKAYVEKHFMAAARKGYEDAGFVDSRSPPEPRHQ
jgi:hypothetical protein